MRVQKPEMSTEELLVYKTYRLVRRLGIGLTVGALAAAIFGAQLLQWGC